MSPAPDNSGETTPWYRQFWPWFIIALPASVVIAGLATLYIAQRHADDLVADDYYREGLRINRELEKTEKALQLGLAAELVFRPRSVEAQLRNDGNVTADTLALTLFHPLDADRDHSALLTRIEPGVFRGALQHPAKGRWHWTLEPADSGDWQLAGDIELEHE